MDYLALAVSELGSISEKNLQLISGKEDFRVSCKKIWIKFWYDDSSVYRCKYAIRISNYAPSSVDSIVSSNGQEDHVSMVQMQLQSSIK